MILQNIVFPPDGICKKEMYIRGSGMPDKNKKVYCIQQGDVISTDTYMNVFDVGAWKKHVDISSLSLLWKLKGEGILKIYLEKESTEAVCLAEINVENYDTTSEVMRYHFQDFDQLADGILYFKLFATTDISFEAWYETEDFGRKEIKISVVICTYKRKIQLEQIIKEIKGISRINRGDGEVPANSFNCPDQGNEGGMQWLRTIVVDNASELRDEYGGGIKVYHNPNTGGSGGFTRGMKETVRNLPEFQATHVLLMDDDVTLQMESIYRLRALLTYVRPEYEQEVVAGRMFRLDRPHVQYTAVEIWNGGDIKHIGLNQDMTDRQCLWSMNENEGGEYGGWWFACYPIEFVKDNDPLPFFLHCDDVEYGLRHGGTPIVLNGIQVWHETYEYRQTPVMTYYDCRNSLYVNSLHNIFQDKYQILKNWKSSIMEQYSKNEYLIERMLIFGMADFLRGIKWLSRVDPGKVNSRIRKKCCMIRLQNAWFWRLTCIKFYLKQIGSIKN